MLFSRGGPPSGRLAEAWDVLACGWSLWGCGSPRGLILAWGLVLRKAAKLLMDSLAAALPTFSGSFSKLAAILDVLLLRVLLEDLPLPLPLLLPGVGLEPNER